jgi:hypothetical protein
MLAPATSRAGNKPVAALDTSATNDRKPLAAQQDAGRCALVENPRAGGLIQPNRFEPILVR